MGAVDELLDKREGLVRKWGTYAVFLADYEASAPDKLFKTDGTPILPGPEYKQLGFTTDAGVVFTKAISVDKVNMDQSLTPVRQDLSGIEQTAIINFGESSSGFVNAVAHGKRVADFPADPDEAWEFHDGELTDMPHYRLWVIAQDGVGPATRYRAEFAHKAKVTAIADRNLGRKSNEVNGFTFGLMRDKESGYTLSRGESGLKAPSGG